jgi:hypothetical protein
MPERTVERQVVLRFEDDPARASPSGALDGIQWRAMPHSNPNSLSAVVSAANDP